jgi:F-type H+-transporting ATPase subunit a
MMIVRRVKCLLVLAFSLFFLFFFTSSYAQQHKVETDHEEEVHAEGIENPGENKFDAKEVIFGHVLDAHEFHFFSYKGKDGKEHHATIPLPVILYSPQKGLSVFSSSRFEHGHAAYGGYKLAGNNIVPVDKNVKVYDLSLTRNVVQMFIALTLLVLIMS